MAVDDVAQVQRPAGGGREGEILILVLRAGLELLGRPRNTRTTKVRVPRWRICPGITGVLSDSETDRLDAGKLTHRWPTSRRAVIRRLAM